MHQTAYTHSLTLAQIFLNPSWTHHISVAHTHAFFHAHNYTTLEAHTHTQWCNWALSALYKRPRTGFLTYEGASFGVEFSGHADVGAQVEHDQHGGDHDDALPQQQRLEITAKSDGGKQKNAWIYCVAVSQLLPPGILHGLLSQFSHSLSKMMVLSCASCLVFLLLAQYYSLFTPARVIPVGLPRPTWVPLCYCSLEHLPIASNSKNLLNQLM